MIEKRNTQYPCHGDSFLYLLLLPYVSLTCCCSYYCCCPTVSFIQCHRVNSHLIDLGFKTNWHLFTAKRIGKFFPTHQSHIRFCLYLPTDVAIILELEIKISKDIHLTNHISLHFICVLRCYFINIPYDYAGKPNLLKFRI